MQNRHEGDRADDGTRRPGGRHASTLRRAARLVGALLLSAALGGIVLVAYALFGTYASATGSQHRAERALVHVVERTVRVVARPAVPRVVWPRLVPLGTALARLTIPAAGVRGDVVLQGVDEARLEEGPGHYPSTPLPGEPGNLAIAGHRTTWLRPFYDLQAVRPGDHVTLSVRSLTWVYTVVSLRTVLPTDVSVARARKGWWLTLTTCTPRYSAARRLVVLARLDLPATLERAPRHLGYRTESIVRAVVPRTAAPAPAPPPTIVLAGWALASLALATAAGVSRGSARVGAAALALVCWWEACGALVARLPPSW